MSLTRIHINQHVIRDNSRNGRNAPPITVKTGKRNFKAHTVEILGPSTVVHRPSKPLPCGARVWVETRSDVIVTEFTNGE